MVRASRDVILCLMALMVCRTGWVSLPSQNSSLAVGSVVSDKYPNLFAEAGYEQPAVEAKIQTAFTWCRWCRCGVSIPLKVSF